MSIKTSIRRVPRPMIARNGGTHDVDLAVSDPTGGTDERSPMRKVSEYTDDNGDTDTCYEVDTNAKGRLVENTSRMAWPFGIRGGANEVVVTETGRTQSGDAYQIEDVQPEPGEADGEGQNANGRQSAQDSDDSIRVSRGTIRYARRNGGIG